jgi:hypothetical protein
MATGREDLILQSLLDSDASDIIDLKRPDAEIKCLPITLVQATT